jgi:hypothetical protein
MLSPRVGSRFHPSRRLKDGHGLPERTVDNMQAPMLELRAYLVSCFSKATPPGETVWRGREVFLGEPLAKTRRRRDQPQEERLMTRFAVLALALGCVLSTGCATIISGTSQSVSFSSDPPGALVNVDGQSAMTPTSLKLKRKSSPTASFSKEGYHSTQQSIGRGVEPWIFGNILLGGIIGLGVDAITGAMYKFDDTSIHVALPPQARAVAPQPIYVAPPGYATPPGYAAPPGYVAPQPGYVPAQPPQRAP